MNRGQILALLQMQDGMNRLVNPDWRMAGYPWLRAVVVEGTEAMEHLGWKWWKQQTPDIEQLHIELVDIFHFAISDALITYGDFVATANHIEQAMLVSNDVIGHGRTEYHLSSTATLNKLELMIAFAADRRFSWPLFRSIMDDVGMSWNDMFIGYVSKNVLNTFRQRHGYKDGTYVKDWDGAEDNVRLAEIVATMDPNVPGFGDLLYDRLRLRYDAVLNK